MATTSEFNERLHRAVNDGVAQKNVQIVDPAEVPAADQLPELVADNLRKGKPLLSGLKVYRGSKDPDVDAGTFDVAYKHATPSFATARGYAETANQHIGLASKDTHGFGVIAEYDLPPNAVFFGNFGLEALGNSSSAQNGLTVAELEDRLIPLARAYVSASDDKTKEESKAALLEFQRRYLFELAVPAEQAAAQQWVVQFDDTKSRLLVHEDRGALADVMIEVVKARKSAVDEHTPKRIQSYLNSLAVDCREMIESFEPGVVESIRGVDRAVHGTLNGLREAAASSEHESLSVAIAWRRETQRGIRLTQLTNSGVSIEHDHPQLSVLPIVQKAAETLEFAAYRQQERPGVLNSVALFEAGLSAARVRDEQRADLPEKIKTEKQSSSALDKCQRARSTAIDKLNDAQREHLQKSSGNIFSRLRYRLTDESQTIATIRELNEHTAAHDKNIDRLSKEWTKASDDLKNVQRSIQDVDQEITRHERYLRDLIKDGALRFIPPNKLPAAAARLTASDWTELAKAGQNELAKSDDCAASGRNAVKFFRDINVVGLEKAAELYHEQTELPARAKSLVALAAEKGVSVDLKRANEAVGAGTMKYPPLLVGNITVIDPKSNVAVINVGRGEGMPVRLNDLTTKNTLQQGSKVRLELRSGRLNETHTGMARSADVVR
jgi:uncharacterized coiled-coil protein SlyX